MHVCLPLTRLFRLNMTNIILNSTINSQDFFHLFRYLRTRTEHMGTNITVPYMEVQEKATKENRKERKATEENRNEKKATRDRTKTIPKKIKEGRR